MPVHFFNSSKCLLIVLCVVLVSWTAAQQQFTLVVQRDQYPDIRLRWNLVTLNCRDSNVVDHPNYFFWLNSTLNDLRKITIYINSTFGLRFTIDPTIEGDYFCGPDMFSISQKVPLVAYPIPRPSSAIQTRTVRVAIDTPITVIEPFVAPGALLAQYYIDWINATSSEVLARIDGPRSLPHPIDSSMKYSVDPVSFALTINSVSDKDRGLYLGMVGVVDPAGEQRFVYEQAETSGVMLEVYESPTFLQPPLDQVISHGTRSSINFTCIARGYPRPTITWYRNMIEVSLTSEDYQEYSENIGDDTVRSTLIKSNLIPQDSGTFAFKGTVEPGGDISPISETTMADLSVLEISDARIDVTTTGSVIFTIFLAARVSADVQVSIFFRDSSTGATLDHVSLESYSNINQLTYTLPNAPYSAYTAIVSVIHGAVQSPLFGPLSPFEAPAQYSAGILTAAVLLTAILITVMIIIPIATIFCCTKMVRQLRDAPVPLYEDVDLCHNTPRLPERNRTMIHPFDSAQNHDSSIRELGIPFEMTNFAMDNREGPNHTYDLPEEDMEHDQDTSSGYDNIDTIVPRCCNDSTHDLYHEQNHDSSIRELGIPFEMTNFAMDNREGPNHTYDLPEEDMEHDQDTSSRYDNIDTIVPRCCNDSTHDLYQEDDYPAVHEQNHDSSVLELGIPSAFEMTNVAIDNQEGPNHTCDLPEEDMECEQVPGGGYDNIDTIVLRGRNDSTRNLSQEDDHPDVHEQISE